MRRLASLLPYIPVLVGVGWLATRFRIVLGVFLIAHGLVHVMFVVPEPAREEGGLEWPFHLDRSWALSGLGSGPARAIGILLMIATIAAFAVAGIALLADLGWWSGAAIAGAAASTALLGLYFHPMLVLGLAINAFVLTVAGLGWPTLSYSEA
ncbi:MAG TPA: hypothetical protein VF097_03040 [Actinomycetota bacterium]